MKRLKDKAFRYRCEKWFWLLMVIPTAIWLRNSVLWVAMLSIYALVISAGAAEEAAEASKQSKRKKK